MKRDLDAYDLQEAERKRQHRELAKAFVRICVPHYPRPKAIWFEKQVMYDDAGNPLTEPVRECYLVRIPKPAGRKKGSKSPRARNLTIDDIRRRVKSILDTNPHAQITHPSLRLGHSRWTVARVLKDEDPKLTLEAFVASIKKTCTKIKK